MRHCIWISSIIFAYYMLDHPLSQLFSEVSIPYINYLSDMTRSGVQLIFWGILLFFSLYTKRSSLTFISFDFLLLLSCSIVITFIFKCAVGRIRPEALLSLNFSAFSPFAFKSYAYSFPSSHSSTAFLLAFLLSHLFPKWKIGFILTASCFALLRVVLLKHFLSDCIFGAWIANGLIKYAHQWRIYSEIQRFIWTKIMGKFFNLPIR